MFTSRRMVVFAIVIAAGLGTAESSSAAVMPRRPESIVISKLTDLPEMVFVIYPIRAVKQKEGKPDQGMWLIDPATAERENEAVVLPHDLPEGELGLVAVPRALAEKRKGRPDPTWLDSTEPGIVRIAGSIKTWRVEKYSAVHRYRLDKTEEGLKLTLTNPDVLLPYPPERIGEDTPRTSFQWAEWAGFIAGGALVLALGAWLFWRFKRGTPPPTPPNQG